MFRSRKNKSRPGSAEIVIPRAARTVIYACIFFTALAFYLFLCIMSLRIVRQNTDSNYQKHCEALLTSYSQSITELLNRYQSDLKTFSNADIFKSGTEADIIRWMTVHDDRRPSYFVNVLFADLQGNAFLTSGMTTKVADRAYFQNIISGGAVTAVDGGTISKTAGIPSFHIARAVYDKHNKLIGIVAGTVDLTTVQNILKSVRIGNSGYAFIVNDEGKFLSYPLRSEILRGNTTAHAPDGSLAIDFMLRHKQGFIHTKSVTGVPVQIAFGPINGTSWTLGISIPEKDTDELYSELRRTQIKIFAVIIVSVTLIAIIFAAIFLNAQQLGIVLDPYDKLTGLWTQARFEKAAQAMLRRKPEVIHVFISADISAFKMLSQTYGAKVTDPMLLLLASSYRTFMEQNNGILGHGYADRFYMLAPVKDSVRMHDTIVTKISEINNITRRQNYPFYTKYGAVIISPGSPVPAVSDLIEQASYAKNTIRNKFINQYALFTEDMRKKLMEEQRIERHMEKSLDDGEFFVMYQPKISLATGKISGAEALVRWNNPDYGILPPDMFIPLFEKDGFIIKLDFYVYTKVFEFLQRQLEADLPVVPVSVNMSRAHLNPEQFMTDFMRAFHSYAIPSSLVEVEIVERTSDSGKQMLRELTDQLHRNGFRVAMDDFGSGESSLNMLSTIPVDVLKFDQMFLRSKQFDDKATKGFITKLVELGKELNKTILFEGAETKDQIEFLKSIRCDQVQGFYYARPLTEKDFIAYIEKHV